MRALVLAALVLTGCLSGDAEDAPMVPSSSGRPASETNATAGGLVADAPDLPAGRAFTFREDYLYDSTDRVTVVVAEARSDGYLLAGATQEDVVNAAIWGRSWMGPVDRSLSDGHSALLDFPLMDGKSWPMRDGLVLTAREVEVETPTGREPGFRIEGRDERAVVTLVYAPSVGWFTQYTITLDGEPFLDLRLERVSTVSSYVYWEPGPAAATDDAKAVPFNAPAGYDAILASAGGTKGGRTVLTPPLTESGAAWIEEFPGEEEWRTRVYPPYAGPWLLSGAAPPDGFGYLRVVAVKWIQGVVQPE